MLSLVGLAYIYLKNTKNLKPKGIGFKVAHTPKEDTLTQLETLKKQEEASAPENVVSAENLLENALKALEENQDGEAERILIQIITINDRHPEANQKLGMLYLKNGLASKAEPFLRILTEEDQNNASHLSNLGYALFMQNRLAEAKEVYEEALSLDSSRPGRFASLAQVYMALKQYDVAVDLLKKAVSVDPKNVDFLLLLAESYYQLGHMSEAMVTTDSVLALDPQNVDAKDLLQKMRSNPLDSM